MLAERYYLKSEALLMRKQGYSIGKINRKLKIPRSTLSGWLRNIKLTNSQQRILKHSSLCALSEARKKAVKWHNLQKKNRLQTAFQDAKNVLSNIDVKNKYVLELALAMLYLGEGGKSNGTSMGNSNPLILNFFIKLITNLFNVKISEIRCELHLRSDQNIKESVLYWSRKLAIPKTQFSATIDKRTAKSKTYPYYKGVCVVRCGKIAIQRRIVHLAEEFSKIAILRQS